MKALTKRKGVHNQIWVLGKLWNVKYVTAKLETEKPVKKKLFYLPDDESLKKNTDNRKEELNKRKIIIITKNGC